MVEEAGQGLRGAQRVDSEALKSQKEFTIKLIAIDPGKRTGYAIFEGSLYTDIGVLVGEEEIWPWVAKQRPQLWVVEDYLIRNEDAGGFNHRWQSVFPAQVIGAIKFFAWNTGVPVILQQASIKYAASPKCFGKPYIKKKNKDHLDAVLHGLYYLKLQEEKTRKG